MYLLQQVVFLNLEAIGLVFLPHDGSNSAIRKLMLQHLELSNSRT
jgi:hypothetical protein